MKILSVPCPSNEDFIQRVKDQDLAFVDALELRCDKMLGSLNMGLIRKLENGRLKIIFTARRGHQTDEEVRDRYREALRSGVDYVDIDLDDFDLLSDLLDGNHSRLILSHHNYGGPELPLEISERMFEVEAGFYKFAISTEESYQVFQFLKRFEELKKKKENLICVFMGAAGEWGRIAYEAFSIQASYLGIPGFETAPGQPDIMKWQGEYRPHSDSQTSLYGILGDPIEHSRSPLFHNHFFKKENLNCLYLRFQGKDLSSFFHSLPKRVRGLSVTTPYKRAVVPFVKELGPVAKASGVVNTLVRSGDDLKGYNTDGTGIRCALEAHFPEWKECQKILVLGAGGVARSVLAVFQDFKDRIYLRNRTESKAQDLAREFGVHWISMRDSLELENSVIIQCTSAGMGGDKSSPIPPFWLDRSSIVVESIYHPVETPLVKMARDNGARVITGVEMFIHQAIEQQKLWFEGKCFDYQSARDSLPDPDGGELK